jgi:hypothetical protein
MLRLILVLGDSMVTLKAMKMKTVRISENIGNTTHIYMVPSLKNRNSTETVNCLYL